MQAVVDEVMVTAHPMLGEGCSSGFSYVLVLSGEWRYLHGISTVQAFPLRTLGRRQRICRDGAENGPVFQDPGGVLYEGFYRIV